MHGRGLLFTKIRYRRGAAKIKLNYGKPNLLFYRFIFNTVIDWQL